MNTIEQIEFNAGYLDGMYSEPRHPHQSNMYNEGFDVGVLERNIDRLRDKITDEFARGDDSVWD